MRLFTATYHRNLELCPRRVPNPDGPHFRGNINIVTQFGATVEEVVELIMLEARQCITIEKGYGENGAVRVIEYDIPPTPENMVTMAHGIGGWQLHNIYDYSGMRFVGKVVKVMTLEDIAKGPSPLARKQHELG